MVWVSHCLLGMSLWQKMIAENVVHIKGEAGKSTAKEDSVSNTETALKASIVEGITVSRRMITEPRVRRGMKRKAQLTTTGEIRAFDRAGGLVKTWDRKHHLNHSDLQV